MQTQCEQEMMLLSHNHHISIDCTQKIIIACETTNYPNEQSIELSYNICNSVLLYIIRV